MTRIVQTITSEFDRIKRGFQKLRFIRFNHVYRLFRIFSRTERIAFLVLLALFVLSTTYTSTKFYISHTKVVPAHGGEFSEGFIGTPSFINPLYAQTQTDQELTRLVFAGLYKYDSEGNLIPDLAAAQPQISADQKQYTVTLRQNLKWHDNQTLNADDIVFTIQTLQNADYKSPFRRLWLNTQVQKIDDQTIKFTNKDISAPFISNLTFGIIPKHIWSKIPSENFTGSKYNLQGIGSGPFLIREIEKTKNGEITAIALDSFSNYWQGKPYIDRLNARFYKVNTDAIFALHNKTINAFGFTPFDDTTHVELNKTSLKILQIPTYEYQTVFFNVDKNKALADPTVRKALSKSIDRQALVDAVYQGLAKPTYGPIMPGQIGYNPEVESINTFDRSAAASMLDSAGWTVDKKTNIRTKNAVPLAFTITTNDFILNSNSANEIKNQLEKLNIKVSINIVRTSELENAYIKTRNYEALLFSESTGNDPDPFIFWHSSQALNPGLNLAQYKNTQADKLISEARNTLDRDTRIQDYKEFQKILSGDAPALFLDQSEYIYQISPEIQGIGIKQVANPEDRFYAITHWYIQTKRVWK